MKPCTTQVAATRGRAKLLRALWDASNRRYAYSRHLLTKHKDREPTLRVVLALNHAITELEREAGPRFRRPRWA